MITLNTPVTIFSTRSQKEEFGQKLLIGTSKTKILGDLLEYNLVLSPANELFLAITERDVLTTF